MSLEEINAALAWLYRLTGSKCPLPIETARHLQDWALDLAFGYEDELTGAELGAIWQLVWKLDPPEVQARNARREKRRNKKSPQLDPSDPAALEAVVDESEAKSRKEEIFRLSGTAARKKQGAVIHEEILKRYKALTCPERERAGRIAASTSLSSQYVRRVLKRKISK